MVRWVVSAYPKHAMLISIYSRNNCFFINFLLDTYKIKPRRTRRTQRKKEAPKIFENFKYFWLFFFVIFVSFVVYSFWIPTCSD
ncbi:MAG: hypothetical protein A2Y62_16735 [Candidatus Fischerbacteria bacterium RBG_13_37_8]|uniref:Uncharacterized protein n=1 Tax=Candidatus Fischerbacteria bacterium RBG_13_37_8 TaxID=1817863 RepID=A0A1F5VJR0_9BACT|nr:MAG: hypothetical protein A2Y62_16735 [Candidatus Fischerbacteria bacterium RBG_13_37_8]